MKLIASLLVTTLLVGVASAGHRDRRVKDRLTDRRHRVHDVERAHDGDREIRTVLVRAPFFLQVGPVFTDLRPREL